MGIGPPGLGVLHTSGKADVIPLLSLWTTDRLFTPTVTPMACSSRSVDLDRRALDLVRAGSPADKLRPQHHHLTVFAQGDRAFAAAQDNLFLRVEADALAVDDPVARPRYRQRRLDDRRLRHQAVADDPENDRQARVALLKNQQHGPAFERSACRAGRHSPQERTSLDRPLRVAQEVHQRLACGGDPDDPADAETRPFLAEGPGLLRRFPHSTLHVSSP